MILCHSCGTVPRTRLYRCDCGMLQFDGSRNHLIFVTSRSVLWAREGAALFQQDVGVASSLRLMSAASMPNPEWISSEARLLEVVSWMVCQQVLEA